jgi:hypothetical protein
MTVGRSIDAAHLRRWILHKQRLHPDSEGGDVLRIVDDIVALHATDPLSPYLSLLARVPGFARQILENLLEKEKRLGKVRFVRKTVHVLTLPMLPVAFAAVKRLLIPRAEVWLAHLGLSSREYTHLSRRIENLLEERGRSAQEVKAELGPDVPVSALLNLMCDEGRLVRGLPRKGWKSNLHIYHLWDSYFPDIDLRGVPESEARARVVRRYLEVFGPVTLKDVAWWTGFPVSDVRSLLRQLEPELVGCEVLGVGGDFFILEEQWDEMAAVSCPEGPVINLLPLLDPLLMGYKERGRLLSPEYQPYVIDRSGNATSVILVDGKVLGIWDYKVMNNLEVKLYWFKKPAADIRKRAEDLARAQGRFISGQDVLVRTCARMRPLSQRTVGGFMSPLKEGP